MSVFFPMLILFVAIVETYATLKRLILSQRREIGILKTIGVSKRRIVFHYFSFALIVGILGSVLGAVLSIYLSKEITYFYTNTLGIPFVLTSIDYKIIGESIFMGVFTCLIGAILPSLMVTRLKSVDILRPYISASMIRGRIPLFERVLGKFCFLSMHTRISMRNLFRNRARTTTTIISIAFSLMLTLSMISFMDSFYVNINTQFDYHTKWDIRAYFSTMKNTSELISVKNWNSVERVEPFITSFITLKFENKTMDALLIAFPANTTMHAFNIICGTGLRDNMLIIGEGIAIKLKVSVADTLNISTHNVCFKANISGIDKEPFFLYTCFTTLKTAQKLFNATNQANGILLDVDANNISDIRKKLYEMSDIQYVEVKSEIKSEWIKLLDEFTVFSYTMLIISMLVAFPLF